MSGVFNVTLFSFLVFSFAVDDVSKDTNARYGDTDEGVRLRSRSNQSFETESRRFISECWLSPRECYETSSKLLL